MKPCEFEGWVELDHDDIFKPQDTWGSDVAYGKYTGRPKSNYIASQYVGRTMVDVLGLSNLSKYRVFRSAVGFRLPGNPIYAKELPLP